MRIVTALLIFALFCTTAGKAAGAPIYRLFEDLPANLVTPVKQKTAAVDKYQRITAFACISIYDGSFLDCRFEMKILGLKEAVQDSENNGGHSHNFDTHPLGKLKWSSQQGKNVAGQTGNDWVYISHYLPEVSGVIETQADLYTPPGWYCVADCLDNTRSGWRWITTLNIGVPELNQLPASTAYVKSRSSDTAHVNENAFAGTSGAIENLMKIANRYKTFSGSNLSVNDMSLPKGGLFDWKAKNGSNIWQSPHSYHRTGESVDINKTDGDCLENKDLLKAVNKVLPLPENSTFSQRQPYKSRLLCETGNSNAIHIDFDAE